MRRRPPALAAAGLALLIPAGAAAQGCGLAAGSGIDAAAGYARYDLGGGVSGPAVGADLTLSTPAAAVRAGYRRLLLDAAAEPDVARIAVAVPAARTIGAAVCPIAHGGASRITLGGGDVTIVAGGVGLRIAAGARLGGVMAAPYAEMRGLAAHTAGTAFGAELDATGYSLGGAAGVQLATRAITVRVEGSLDGFDEGLGPTPYPSQSLELGIGIRF